MICLYHWRGAWQVATKGRADGSGQVNIHPMTFVELAKQTATRYAADWEAFCAKLNPDVFYSMELTGPLNRILVAYPEHELRLLAAWDKQTQAELDIRNFQSPVPLGQAVSHDRHRRYSGVSGDVWAA